jgi:Fe2+ or Zn2+ uptake regulation protein
MGPGLDDLHDLAQERLRGAGLLYTKGRRQLMELLAECGRPVTMAELVDLRPRLTLSSMYRNVVDLEATGLVQRVAGTDDRTRYELAEELIGHHHHTLCTECGAVEDFVIPDHVESALESALTAGLASSGFDPSGHRLDVLGVCASCVRGDRTGR